MALVDVFVWLEKTPVSTLIQSTTYLFPLLEVIHLLGLALLYGAILLVDLRLLGLPIQHQPASRLAAQINPFASLGLAVMVLTGMPLLASEALKCYENPAFWFKMACFVPAVLFHFTVRRQVLQAEQRGTVAAAITGGLSLLMWLGVGLGGRAIAFV